MTLGVRDRIGTVLDGTTRGWAVVLGGDLVRMALGFVAGVLIARALGPDQFGVYVVLGAATAIGGVLVDLGLSQAAVVRVSGVWSSDEAAGRRRGATFFWVRVATAAGITLAAMALARWLAAVIGLPATVAGHGGSTLLILALAGVVAAALGGSISTLLQATRRFGSISIMLGTNSAITLVLAAVLTAADRLDLVTALVVLGILPALLTFLVGRRLLGGRWTLWPPPRGTIRDEVGPLFRVGGWLWLAGLLTALAARMDLLLVNRLSTPSQVGAYGLAFSLAASLGAAYGSLYTVLLPAVSALRSRSEIRQYLSRGLLRSGLFTLILIPLIPLARPVIVAVYGQDYAPAAPFLQLLIPVAGLELLVLPLILLAVPLGVPQWLAVAAALRVAVVACVGWLLLPVWGPTGVIAARAASVAVGAGLVAAVLNRKMGELPRPADPESDTAGRALHDPL